jgi:hypothetical protein
MVDKVLTAPRNVIDLARYQQARASRTQAIGARLCRHCGAALGEGESDDDCSSAGLDARAPAAQPKLRFRAE